MNLILNDPRNYGYWEKTHLATISTSPLALKMIKSALHVLLHLFDFFALIFTS